MYAFVYMDESAAVLIEPGTLFYKTRVTLAA
jgi:hypothetical protein